VTDLSTQTSHSGVHGRPKTTAVIQHKKEKKNNDTGFSSLSVHAARLD